MTLKLVQNEKYPNRRYIYSDAIVNMITFNPVGKQKQNYIVNILST